MGYDYAVFSNPYLIAYLKYLWLFSHKGSGKEKFQADDYDTITRRINKFRKEDGTNRKGQQPDSGCSTIIKVLREDKKIGYRDKEYILNYLVKAITFDFQEPSMPDSWDKLIESQRNSPIFKPSASLQNKLIQGQRIYDFSPQLYKDIQDTASDDAFKTFSEHKNKKFTPLPKHIPHLSVTAIRNSAFYVRVAKEESDIHKIYNFALNNNSYGNCPINGPEIKLPWWRKNPYIFYVVYDKDNNVCANLNLLPLKEDCYYKIRDGIIDERDIHPDDLYSPEEKKLVRYIYVEGINCPNDIHRKDFLAFSDHWIKQIADVQRRDIVLGAIAGTTLGRDLLEALEFDPVVPKEIKRKDKLEFFEVNYQIAKDIFWTKQNPL